ncbi:unnamed protein product [Cuscuta epithymum]|uniref:Uncharacterized protein n=2 Tax=Cuscuta epithymum TaxID=186058 RepID=A0AAV0FJZ0_9ASTE|nr:unnamed protein product [Cuscuta epithymum]
MSDSLRPNLEELEVDREVDDRVLFPPESDFSEEHENQLQPAIVACMALSAASEWTKNMLNRLHDDLKRLYKESGVSWTLTRSKSEEELRDVDIKIGNMMLDNGLIKEIVTPDGSETDVFDDRPLVRVIHFGIIWYADTKYKDAAHDILKKIEEIENQHEQDKKSAAEEGKPLDFSISKKHINNQINLLKMLPVGEMYQDFQNLVHIAARKHVDFILKAEKEINETYRSMIVIRRQFWKHYQEIASFTRNDDKEKHNWSGLEETLDSLAKKADLFKEAWQNEYEQHFGPSKNQKTMQ